MTRNQMLDYAVRLLRTVDRTDLPETQREIFDKLTDEELKEYLFAVNANGVSHACNPKEYVAG